MIAGGAADAARSATRSVGAVAGPIRWAVRPIVLLGCLVLAAGFWTTSVSLSAGEKPLFQNGLGAVVVCGHELFEAPSGAYVESFTRPGNFPLAGGLRADALEPHPEIISFVDSCATGVRYDVAPAGSLEIYAEAASEDSRVAAIAVYARNPGRDCIYVHRPEGRETAVSVDVWSAAGRPAVRATRQSRCRI